MRLNLPVKIALLFFTLIGSGVVSAIYISYQNASELLRIESLKNLSTDLNRESTEIETKLRTLREDVIFLGQSQAFSELVHNQASPSMDKKQNLMNDSGLNQLSDVFRVLMSQRQAYSQIRFIGTLNNGQELAGMYRDKENIKRITTNELQNRGNTKYFERSIKLQKNEIYFSDVNYVREQGKITFPLQPILTTTTPVFTSNNKIIGIIVIDVDFQRIAHELAATKGENHFHFVTNEVGDYILHHDNSKQLAFDFGKRANFSDDYTLDFDTFALSHDLQPENIESLDSGLAAHRVYYDKSNPKRFYLLGSVINEEIINNASRELANKLTIISLIIVLFISVIAALASHYITRRISSLREIADKVASGNENINIAIKGNDEVTDLASSFQSMLHRLNKSRNELTKFTASLERKVVERTEALEKSNIQLMLAKRKAEKNAEKLQETLETSESLRAEAEYAKKLAERISTELEISKETLTKAQEIAHIGHWKLNLETKHLYWSDEVYRISGLIPQEFEANYNAFIQRIHPDDREMVRQAYAESVENHSAYSIVHRVVRPSGEVRYVEERCEHEYNEDGVIISSIGTVLDISEQIKSETALKQAKEEAEAATLAKSEFLANMSHELRTPLNGIIAMTKFTLESELSTEQRRQLTIVHSSGETLLSLLNDILDLSKVEAGKIEREQCEFNVHELVENTVVAHALSAEEKGLQLITCITSDIPANVTGDPTHLKQVIVNLLGNAIKFTRHGEILLRVSLLPSQTDSVILKFTVHDTGIGIPKEKQAKIFERFTQGDNTSTREFHGTGLGITISKQLVEMMGGEIWLESKQNVGTDFHFTIVVEKAEINQNKYQQTNSTLYGKRALVVDKNKSVCQAISIMLNSWNIRTESVTSADQALKILKKSTSQHKAYDYCLIDSSLQKTYQLANKIHNNSALSATYPVILYSARGDINNLHKNLSFAGKIFKPFKCSEFFSLLYGQMNEEENNIGIGQTRSIVNKNLAPLHILVAEDNEVNQHVAKLTLKKLGHKMTLVENGIEAIKAWEHEHFDLIIMDIQMPEQDGLETIKIIREKEKSLNKHIPVIGLSAHAMETEMQKALHAGMDDYVTKPLNTLLLHEAISNLVSHKNDKIVSTNTLEPEKTKKAEKLSNLLSNLDELLDLCDNNTEQLEEMLLIFIKSLEKAVLELKQAIDDLDFESIAIIAHKIKGSSGQVGANDLRQLAIDIRVLALNHELVELKDLYQILALQKDILQESIEMELKKVA